MTRDPSAVAQELRLLAGSLESIARDLDRVTLPISAPGAAYLQGRFDNVASMLTGLRDDVTHDRKDTT